MSESRANEGVAAASLGGQFVNDHSHQAASSAQAAYTQQREAARQSKGALVALPNGAFVSLGDFVDQEYFAGDHTSIFADTVKYLKNPNADCMYAWAAKSDKRTYGKIRVGDYRPVLLDEIREDCELPIETHEVAGAGGKKEKWVACYDVLLMEVPPKAVKKLYKWREAQAVLRTAQGTPFQRLKERIEEESKGYASAEMTMTREERTSV